MSAADRIQGQRIFRIVSVAVRGGGDPAELARTVLRIKIETAERTIVEIVFFQLRLRKIPADVNDGGIGDERNTHPGRGMGIHPDAFRKPAFELCGETVVDGFMRHVLPCLSLYADGTEINPANVCH